jgi:hypothetical protein
MRDLTLRDLLTKVSKTSQPWVATIVRTTFDQPDAVEVHAQFDRQQHLVIRMSIKHRNPCHRREPNPEMP